MGTRPCTPVISCRRTSRPSLLTTARQSRLPLNAVVVARAKHRDGYWMRHYSMLRWTNGARKDASARSADVSSSGRATSSTEVLGGQQINTAYVERDNLTSRQTNGRLVRKTLSHSKQRYFLRRHLALADAVFNFVRPHQALRIAVPQPTPWRKWQHRTPAMAAELTDHIWSLEELLSYRVPPPKG